MVDDLLNQPHLTPSIVNHEKYDPTKDNAADERGPRCRIMMQCTTMRPPFAPQIVVVDAGTVAAGEESALVEQSASQGCGCASWRLALPSQVDQQHDSIREYTSLPGLRATGTIVQSFREIVPWVQCIRRVWCG